MLSRSRFVTPFRCPNEVMKFFYIFSRFKIFESGQVTKDREGKKKIWLSIREKKHKKTLKHFVSFYSNEIKMTDMSMSAEGKEMIDTLSKLDRIKDIRNRTIQVRGIEMRDVDVESFDRICILSRF